MTENIFKIIATGEVGKIVQACDTSGDLKLIVELPDGSLRFLKHINELEAVKRDEWR